MVEVVSYACIYVVATQEPEPKAQYIRQGLEQNRSTNKENHEKGEEKVQTTLSTDTNTNEVDKVGVGGENELP